MSLIFKLFWHVIPYSYIVICLTLAKSTGFAAYLILGISFALSTLKADTFNRKSSTGLIIGLVIAEIVLMITFLYQAAIGFELLLLMVLVDLFWYSELKEKYYLASAFVLFFLSLGLWFLTKNHFHSLVPLASMWIGISLKELENKKESAQRLYDQLRVSEEALKRANHELEAYYETIEEVVRLRERTRISRDIHDSVGHTLATSLIQLQAIEHRLKEKNESEAQVISRLVDFVRSALESTRSIVHDMLDESKENKHFQVDIQDMIQGFSNRTGKKVSFVVSDGFQPICKRVSDSLYRVIQESLTNTLKHSNAQEISIVLSDSEREIFLVIKDNGKGKNHFVQGFGMNQMKKRVAELNGHINFFIDEVDGLKTELVIPKETRDELIIS